MKHLSNFKSFINEKEDKDKKPKKENVDKPGNDYGDFLKDAGKILKDAGFIPNNSEEGGGATGGERLQGSGQYKVPSAEDVKKGIEAVNKAMDRHGITDKNMRAAIQGVIGKESGWAPKNEISYSGTSNSRIREIFGKRVSGLSDTELDSLKKNDTKFWDRVYGSDDPTGASQKLGNTNPGDGAKYLGRGFNGITFKSIYQKMQELYNKYSKLEKSVDIVSNPDSLNDLDVSAEFAVLYFIENLKNPRVKSMYGSNDPNEFEKDNALKAVFHVNAGLGKDLNTPLFRQTLAKSTDFRDDMIDKNMV
jgi:predicted chitinase